jgi:hypothetical protein
MNYEIPKIPLGPTCQVAQRVESNPSCSNRLGRTQTRFPLLARKTLISLSLWRPESPPPSPIYPRRPRPSPATRCCGSGSPFDGEPDGPRRSVAGVAVHSPSSLQCARPSASAAAVRWRGRGPSSRRLPCAWCSARVRWWSPGLAWPGLVPPCSGARRLGRHDLVGHLLPGTFFSYPSTPSSPPLLRLAWPLACLSS